MIMILESFLTLLLLPTHDSFYIIFLAMTFALCAKLKKLILATGADTFSKLQAHRIFISAAVEVKY